MGTAKGMFVLRARADRKSGASRARRSRASRSPRSRSTRDGRLYVASQSWHWGTTIRTSDDLGVTWSDPASSVLVSGGHRLAMQQVWQIQPGRASEPGVVYAGVAPAALFRHRSRRELGDDPRAARPSASRTLDARLAGSACTRSCSTPRAPSASPSRSRRRASTCTDDGGADVARAQQSGVRAQFASRQSIPEFGQCVHKIVQHRAGPDTLFPAEITGALPQRRRRRLRARHIARRAVRLRLLHGDPSARSRRHPHRPANPTVIAARPKGGCASTVRATAAEVGGARRRLPQANAHETSASATRCAPTR